MGTDSEHRSRRSSRSIRLALLIVGLLGLAIGAGFIVAYLLGGNPRLRMFGIVYILASFIVLGLREIVHEMRRARRRSRQNGFGTGNVRP